ncbi:rab-like protein 3 isoform X2 [Musca domestica]|uniref:Rab-like protein 3 n=1 Tax=Musca domestica TaxID=7370 RepID=A0A1I8MLU6_MUSDO|nr:rab-like protein 3 isoform X3 [Musca domestica]XP_058975192.1 rab-like protein 3 isoform X2 [Musca domestica]XP_058975194.1 rab-like protein 3 isoform X2 [Musca domestica]
MSNTIDKVRILLVGDSGVGKTCLTHLIAHGESLHRPGWTVGCNIEVKLHEYKEGTPQQKPYFIELFDVGGSLSHKNSRSVFYAPTDGIILVHDLTNRKSHNNLRDWLFEILSKEGKDTYKPGSNVGAHKTANDEQNAFDPEEFVGAAQIPILVMGTKLDLVDERRQPKTVQKAGGIAEQCGAEEIWLNCRDPRSIAAGTTDAVKLSRFFDRVIEKKQQTRDTGFYGSGITDRRRYNTTSTMPYNMTNITTAANSMKPNSPTQTQTRNVLIEPNVL